MKPIPAELGQTINADYSRLCGRLGLAKVPLDLYIHEEKSAEMTPHGAPINYPYAGYDGELIHIPLFEIAIEGTSHSLDSFDEIPKHWDLRSHQWPEWRANLWHETIHQYDRQVFGTWKPGNAHGASWQKGLAAVAEKLGISSDQLAKVTGGIVVPLVQVKAP